MAPVATNERTQATETNNGPVKPAVAAVAEKVFNPFYSPPAGDEDDAGYKYADYKVNSILFSVLFSL